MNRPNDDHHESNRDFYDRISNAYDFIADSSEHQAREMGEKALALQAGERVLEIGYGTGNTILDLAQNHLAGPLPPSIMQVRRRICSL